MNIEGNSGWHYVNVNIYSLLNCLYAISAVLITFGAVIGKVSPFQLVLLTIIELVLHSINYKVLMASLNLQDMGGTYTDHMFGAYFGLAVAWILGKPRSEPDMGSTPDVFSLIGTVLQYTYTHPTHTHHTHTHAYTHTHTHTYKHAHTHTDTHTHIDEWKRYFYGSTGLHS